MTLIPVTSSQISQIGHDPRTNTLVVVFKNGSRYKYANVTTQLFEQLRDAESVGSFFSKNIKGNTAHPFEREV